jgi:hypothetical protein
MLYREIIAVCSQIHTEHTNTLCGQNVQFLQAFAKLRKATISYVMSVCLGIFVKFDISVFFRKSVDTVQVLLKSDTNNRYFTLSLM